MKQNTQQMMGSRSSYGTESPLQPVLALTPVYNDQVDGSRVASSRDGSRYVNSPDHSQIEALSLKPPLPPTGHKSPRFLIIFY